MSFEVIWSENAINDLFEIKIYIEKDSKISSQKVFENILFSVRKLSKFQNIGRVIPELNKENYKELLLQNYRVMYKINDEKIIISAVRHSSREFNFGD